MVDGSAQLYDQRPCDVCGGRVALLSSACEACGARVIGPQPGPQDMFLAADAEIVLYGGAAYGGKALRLDEPIPTPSGWADMGDLEVGDVVYDEHGRETAVVEAHPVNLRPDARRLIFDDGAAIECCVDHLWFARGQVLRTTELSPGDLMPVGGGVSGPCRIQVPDRTHRAVISIEHAEPVPMRCITVANESGLFLAGRQHLVTHNSYALLLDALRYIDTPGWTGLILRRQSADYSDPSSIFEKAKRLYAGLFERSRSSGGTRDIRFPSGATLAFRHLGDANLLRYQGNEYAWIGIDEATHFEMQWIRWMLTRMRTNCGSKPRMRLTCNPDPDHAFSKWVEPYLVLDKSDPRYGCADREMSGKTRHFAISASGKEEIIWAETAEECAEAAGRPVNETKSFAFIAADLKDNPIGLAEDPGYVANLATSGRTNEKRLRDGNWLIKDDRGGLIQRGYFGVVDKPLAMIVRRVRAWDLAARSPSKKRRDPDYTVGVRIEWDVHGRWYITDMVACRRETTDVDKLMAAVASADGPMVVQSLEIEGGASGITAEQHLRRVLRSLGRCGPIYSARPGGDKVEKARPMTNGLSLGMKGNRPRVVAIEYDPDTQPGEVFEPIAYILDNGWMVQPYEDTGDHPPTVGSLFWRQCLAFGNDEEHDDIPDAMAIANRTPADVVELADPYDPLRRLAALT